MTRRYDNEEFFTGSPANFDWGRSPNQNIAIGPALFWTQDSCFSHLRDAETAPGDFPRSQEEARRRISQPARGLNFTQAPQPSPYQFPTGYLDAGLAGSGESRDRGLQTSPVQGSRAAPISLETEKEANVPVWGERSKRFTQVSKKRTRADASFSAYAEDILEDATSGSRRSTGQYKRTKVSSKNNDTDDKGEKKIRKVSKLKVKIAKGKGPKKGSLGPNGEVRTREDGRMEFRDATNPEWTLAAYHSDYRRQFLDEAAQLGEFDHTAARGEANDDETSYQPEQQSWGPSRADWQNIVNADGKKVMFEVERPESRRPPYEPNHLTRDGLVLLDTRNHPVKDWRELNKTLSTEMESWRWEALIRMYPWLTVADLLARMPHARVKKGVVLALQTPQAFTNRAHRFRVPNQIPAFNPKNGSETYKVGILKNLAETRMNTTEGLSALDPDQVDKVRNPNKGKFKENSRYIVKKDDDSAGTPLPPKKRKVHFEDDDSAGTPLPPKKRKVHFEDTESETEQGEPKAKKLCTRTPQSLELEAHDWTQGSIYDNADQDAYLGGPGIYDEPIDTTGLLNNQEQASFPQYTADQNGDSLVPLFSTVFDRDLALMVDPNFNSPNAVIWARRNGNQQTGQIAVFWFRQNTPRYVGPDGVMIWDVVDASIYHMFEAEEPIPGHTQYTPEVASAQNVASSSTLGNNPYASDPLFNQPSYGGYQDFAGPASSYAQMPAIPSSQPPLVFPNHTGRYQTEPDISEEIWRDDHGFTDF